MLKIPGGNELNTKLRRCKKYPWNMPGFLALFALGIAAQCMLSACCPKCPEPETRIIYREPPPDIVTKTVKSADAERITATLKPLLDDPDLGCRAAFYLCVYDGARKEYVQVLYDDRCSREIPAEVRIVKNLVYWEKRARKCIKAKENTSGALEKCREDNDLLGKELERVKFECKKKEEIRKDAEQWRIK